MRDTQIVGVLVNALLIAAHTVRLTLVIPQWYKAEQNDEWRHDDRLYDLRNGYRIPEIDKLGENQCR